MFRVAATWYPDTDETKIVYSNDFEQSPPLTRLDILKDILGELEYKYNNILKNEGCK